MNNKVELVDHYESIAMQVGRFLLSKKFDLADNTGTACLLDEVDSISILGSELGILYKDPNAKPHKYLFGLITLKPRRIFLGIFWLINSVRGANEQNWIFEAHSHKHLELIRPLIQEMVSIFNVNITLHIVYNKPDNETYLSDYDM